MLKFQCVSCKANEGKSDMKASVEKMSEDKT